MNYKKITIAAALIGMLFLSGCAYFQRPPSFKQEPWKQRQAELRQIKNWEMSGALSITYNKKRDIARFKWVQKQDSYAMNISGPLNIGSVKIIGDADHVELWRTNKKSIVADTPEQLTKEQLGWRLPISNIRYWILSLPVPTKINAMRFDQYGHLTDLEQNGWQIKYVEFQTNAQKNIDLPKTILLNNKDVAIKIKVTKRVLE